MNETLPLSKIHGAILEFLQGREDVVLFGAQAVNAYVSEPRMTQDIDLLSTNAEAFSEKLRDYLSDKFHIAVRILEIKEKGFRIYQIRNEGNRHLVNVRIVSGFPQTLTIENIRVLSPAELIASKVISFQSRFGKSKSWTDRRDLIVLLLRFPELKIKNGEVEAVLQRDGANEMVLNFWAEIVEQDLQIEVEDEDLNF